MYLLVSFGKGYRDGRTVFYTFALTYPCEDRIREGGDLTKTYTVEFGNRQLHFFTAIHVRIFVHLTCLIMASHT